MARRRAGSRIASQDGPEPVDIHVGQRIRERRVSLGLSQTLLGQKVNLTFQQIQKYERGANRVSASVMWMLSEALDVPPSFFFDGLQSGAPRQMPEILNRRALRLIRRFNALSKEHQDSIMALLGAMSGMGDQENDLEEEIAEIEVQPVPAEAAPVVAEPQAAAEAEPTPPKRRGRKPRQEAEAEPAAPKRRGRKPRQQPAPAPEPVVEREPEPEPKATTTGHCGSEHSF